MPNTVVETIGVNDDGSVTVVTDSDKLTANRLIITLGSWSTDLLGGLGLDIEVIRKPTFWFQIDRHDIKYQNGFPAFLIESGEQCFYCVPEVDYLGLKVAEHSGGTVVERPMGLDRNQRSEDLAAAESFLDEHFDFTRRRLVHHAVCMYSMSRDSHFVVDSHPDCSNIVFAAGMSGHGFKFAPVIGERLVEMLDFKTNEQFDFLRMGNRQLA